MTDKPREVSVQDVSRNLASQRLGEAMLTVCDLEAQLLAERQAHAAELAALKAEPDQQATGGNP